jgi:hypothetical protein
MVARHAVFRATATLLNALRECSPGEELHNLKNRVLHASSQQLPRGMERVCVSWSDGGRSVRPHYRHLDLRNRAREMAGLSEAMTGLCARALNVRLRMIPTSLDLKF